MPSRKPTPASSQQQADAQIAKVELQNLRLIINKLDDLIIQSVARRMAVSRTVGALKKLHGLKIKDSKREKELQALHKKLAREHGITYPTLRKIFDLIMKESKRIQK